MLLRLLDARFLGQAEQRVVRCHLFQPPLRMIARVLLPLDGVRQLGDRVVEHLVFMRGHHAHAPARRAAVFRGGIHEDGAGQADGEQRDEIIGKRDVHIIGQNDQVRALFDDHDHIFQGVVIEIDGWRIAAGDEEEPSLSVLQHGRFQLEKKVACHFQRCLHPIAIKHPAHD